MINLKSERYLAKVCVNQNEFVKVPKWAEAHNNRVKVRITGLHPKDKNIPKENKGVQWAKSRKTERDKKLNEFYKTHVYTWVSETNRAWVAIPQKEEEEE